MPEPRSDATSGVPLQIRDLHVTFGEGDARVMAVDGVDLTARRGGVLAIVGESGSGKSATALAAMSLLPASAQVTGAVLLGGDDLVAMPEKRRTSLRGNNIALVFQDALAALNPYRTVGRQLADAYLRHRDGTRSEARARAVEMLERVGISNAGQRIRQYPHEFSGGMRQRVMIAMAVINEPDVLIADEPTTALDVSVQKQVLELLTDLTDELGMALVIITHDLGVVAQVADDVAVMYAGRIVETGSVTDIFDSPAHPYTQALLGATPDLQARAGRLRTVAGAPASGADRPTGCAFHPRCPYAAQVGEACRTQVPQLSERPGSHAHRAACHLTQDGGPLA